ncbi:hypothetical protein ANN_16001 [Periplaneta americana]|uniref:Uncharacterized protein n=1 Tax=Periplaneta americana TaxID=6978 RepID=A0ABQ8SHS3_PERAM|nr:hypothetical protein ANN_16001 [Periplaneta americana]
MWDTEQHTETLRMLEEETQLPEAADSLDQPPWNVVQRCWMASAMAPEADLVGGGVSPRTNREALGEFAEAGMRDLGKEAEKDKEIRLDCRQNKKICYPTPRPILFGQQFGIHLTSFVFEGTPIFLDAVHDTAEQKLLRLKALVDGDSVQISFVQEALVRWGEVSNNSDPPSSLAVQNHWGVPSILEHSWISRSDGKRPDGLTLVPWHIIIFLSLLRLKYLAHGSWCSEGKALISTIGRSLVQLSGDPRSSQYLRQRIGIAIQRGNATSILASFPESSYLDEIAFL